MEELPPDTCNYFEDLYGIAQSQLVRVTGDSLTKDGTLNRNAYTETHHGIAMCLDCGYKVARHRHRVTASPPVVATQLPREIRSTKDVQELLAAKGIKASESDASFLLDTNAYLVGRSFNDRTAADRIIEKHIELQQRAKSSTRFAFTETTGVLLNGPFDDVDHPKIVTGTDANGYPVIVKFVPTPPAGQPDPSFEAGPADVDKISVHAARMELLVCSIEHKSDFLVQCTTISAESTLVAHHAAAQKLVAAKKTAIVMPHYPQTAARAAVSNDLLGAKLVGIAKALTFLHNQSPPIVHMDVKPSNIFIDQQGTWRLGDFDSCCFNGSPIYSTTRSFLQSDVKLSEGAKFSHDWGMLLGTVATLMLKGQKPSDVPVSDLQPEPECGIGFGHMPREKRDAVLKQAKGCLMELVEKLWQLEERNTASYE